MMMQCLFSLGNDSEKVKLFTLRNEEALREKSSGFAVSVTRKLEIA